MPYYVLPVPGARWYGAHFFDSTALLLVVLVVLVDARRQEGLIIFNLYFSSVPVSIHFDDRQSFVVAVTIIIIIIIIIRCYLI